MIRPGAPFAPAVVWHELQSPDVSEPDIARVPFVDVTFTVNGAATFVPEEKLPTLFAVSVSTALFASVTTTLIAPMPSQSFGSCAVGYTVPAMK